jgi:HEAT repeat protein
MRSLSTPKRALLFALTQGAGFVPVPGAGAGFSALESLVSESEFSPRASVAILLAKDRSEETEQALEFALKDDDWPVRAAAAQALAIRNQPSLSRDLVPLLTDKKPQVQYRAAAAYIRLRAVAAHQIHAAPPQSPPGVRAKPAGR